MVLPQHLTGARQPIRHEETVTADDYEGDVRSSERQPLHGGIQSVGDNWHARASFSAAVVAAGSAGSRRPATGLVSIAAASVSVGIVPAEQQGVPIDPITPTNDSGPTALRDIHDGPAADADGQAVRHPELRARAADLAGAIVVFTGEPADDDAEVAGRTADVHDDGIVVAREVGSSRIEFAGPEPIVSTGYLHDDDEPEHPVRAVVLGEEGVRLEPFFGDHGDERVGDGQRDAVQRGVEHGGVLAFEQAGGADVLTRKTRVSWPR